MKYKLLALSLAILTSIGFVKAQNNCRCGYDEYIEHLNKQYPGYRNALDEDIKDATSINAQRAECFTGGTYTIRVVFHVVHSNATEKVSELFLDQQIKALNRDYAATNADKTNIRPEFLPFAAGNSKIQFVKEYVEYKETTIKTFFSSLGGSGGMADDVKKTATGGLDAWDVNKYLNIWICNFKNPYPDGTGEVVGYATPPPGLAPIWDDKKMDMSLQGLVLSYETIGDNIQQKKGRTAVHEVGHYLGLRHTWGDKQPNCGDDFVWDTPGGATPLLEYGPSATFNNPCTGYNFVKNGKPTLFYYTIYTPIIKEKPDPNPNVATEIKTWPSKYYYTKDTLFIAVLNKTNDDTAKWFMQYVRNQVKVELHEKTKTGKYYPEDTIVTNTKYVTPYTTGYNNYIYDTIRIGGTWKKFYKQITKIVTTTDTLKNSLGKDSLDILGNPVTITKSKTVTYIALDSLMQGGKLKWTIIDTIKVTCKYPKDSLINESYTKVFLQPNTCSDHTIDPNETDPSKKDKGDFPDFYEDYMSYSDENCHAAFTNGQVSLMQTVLCTRRAGIATVSIDEVYNIGKLEFYPNPATNTVYLLNTEINATYQITTITSSIAETGKVENNSIDVNNLSNGIYTIRVNTQNSTLVNKLVITK